MDTFDLSKFSTPEEFDNYIGNMRLEILKKQKEKKEEINGPPKPKNKRLSYWNQATREYRKNNPNKKVNIKKGTPEYDECRVIFNELLNKSTENTD